MSRIPLGTPGWIYALSCGAMPGLIKLGATTSTPAERARQLTAATASPSPFVVLYSCPVSDCNAAESDLHEYFSGERVNDKREFFNISFERAARAMDSVAAHYRADSPYKPVEETAATMKLPWSELFATFPDDGSDRQLTDSERLACERLARKVVL